MEVFTRPGCGLCEDALAVLEDVAPGLAVVRRNILSDEGWFARYRYRIPVLVVDGEERLALHFTEAAVREALEGRREGREERGTR